MKRIPRISKFLSTSSPFLIHYSNFFHFSTTSRPLLMAASVKEAFVGAYELFPGRSPLKKLGILSTATSLASIAIAQEWYIVDEETTISVLTCTIFAFLFNRFKDTAQQFIQKCEDEDTSLFMASYRKFSEGLKDCLEHHRLVLQSPAIIEDYHAIQRENLELQAKMSMLQQQIAIYKHTQSNLDLLARQIIQRDYEKRLSRALNLVAQLRSELQSPEMQQRIMQNSIAALERLATAA